MTRNRAMLLIVTGATFHRRASKAYAAALAAALEDGVNVHVPPVEAKARAFKALMAAGRAANSAEDFAGALEAFEAAFGLQPDAVPLLSAANMLARAGEARGAPGRRAAPLIGRAGRAAR